MWRIDSAEIIDYDNYLPKEVIIKQISCMRNKQQQQQT